MRDFALLTAAGVLALGCGPGPRPGQPPPVTGTVSAPEPLPSDVQPDGAVLGLLCADPAAGGMAVVPLAASNQRGRARPRLGSQVRQFSIYGWSGRRMGAFAVVGGAEAGGRQLAIGSYAGSPPCTEPTQAGQPPEKVAACQVALGECALAVGEVEAAGGPGARPYDEVRDPVVHATSGACVARGHLVVNIDGAGDAERFPLTALSRRGKPPVEILASQSKAGAAACAKTFAISGAAGNRGGRTIDVLGVIDIDADGRFELILGYRKKSGPGTIAVYSATETPMRLDLMSRQSMDTEPSAHPKPRVAPSL